MRTSAHASVLFVVCVVAAAQTARAAAPADYPNRPIRMIMPNAPGSSNDTLGRLLATRLGEALGQQIVVDNRAGAGGVLGTEIGKHANPDGYTIIVSSEGALSLAPHIYSKLAYDPLRDFEFIGLFVDTPNILVVTPALPVKNARELIDYAKARQGQLNMASAGAGSQSHLTGYALMLSAGFSSVHIPYKGGGPSIAALVAGESQWSIPPAAGVMTLVRSGRLRALAHTLAKRSALFADMPALAETLPGFTRSGWKGLLAPRGTPKAVIDKLHAAMLRVVGTREAKELFALQGSEVVTGSGDDMKRLLVKEIADTALVVKAAGLKVE
jgi:tripartite-type tricarboxylate transporter receptor subunit TctC